MTNLSLTLTSSTLAGVELQQHEKKSEIRADVLIMRDVEKSQ